MAVTPRLCSNHSYPINLSTEQPLIRYHPLALLYCPRTCSFLDSIRALAIERANEAVTIERKSLVLENNNGESSKEIEIVNQNIGLALRRKKRRKRRCYSDCLDLEERDKTLFSRHVKTGSCLTPKEESGYSWYIKEEARIGTLRKSVEEKREIELDPNQLAKAAGMSRRRLDKLLVNAKKSQEKIIQCYGGLVASIAASHQGSGLSLQDLIQEGIIGLLRGARKFNPKKGVKLSTYAYWWIRLAITRAIVKKSRLIRLPRKIYELVPKICDAITKLRWKLRRMPSYDEIAEVLGMDVSTVRLVMERNRAPISLNQSISRQGYLSLQDIIPGPVDLEPEEIVKKQMRKRELENLFHSVLCDREAKIVKLLFGLNGDTPLGVDETGRVLKLSSYRISAINRRALSKLRERIMLDPLTIYIR